MKAFQVRQFFTDPPEVPAKKVIVQYFSILVGKKMWGILPIFVHPVGLQFIAEITGTRAIEAIREDLIHDSASVGSGGLKICRIAGQLPEVSLIVTGIGLAAAEHMKGTLGTLTAEVIEIQPTSRERELGFVDLISVTGSGQFKGNPHSVGGVCGQNHLHTGNRIVFGHFYSQVTGLIFTYTAKWGFILF